MDITPTIGIRLSTSKEEGWLFDELLDQGNDHAVKAMEIGVIFSDTVEFQDVESSSESLLAPPLNLSESFVESHLELLDAPAASEKETPMAHFDTATLFEKEMLLKGYCRYC